MGKEVTVLIAGNPDMFPLEYYDKKAGAYEGVLPELFEEFSGQSGYEIEYYLPGSEDQREEFSRQRQVDIISGSVSGEEFRYTLKEPVTVLISEEDGEPVSYRLWVTEVAPLGLREELEDFFTGLSKEKVTGLLVEQAGEKPGKPGGWIPVAGGLFVSGILLTLAVVLFVRKKRRRTGGSLRIGGREKELSVVGRGEMEARFKSGISRYTRVLYYAVYFHVDAGPLFWAEGGEATECFRERLLEAFWAFIPDRAFFFRVADNGFLLLRQSGSRREMEEWLALAFQSLTFPDSGESRNPQIYAGVYPLKNTDEDVDRILKNARQAVGQAVREERRFQVFDGEMQRRLIQEKEYQRDISRGLEQEEFLLYIQFFMDARTREIVGGEALARWQHPKQGLLLPGRFVPVFEKADMIERLDYYMLDKAAAFLESLSQKQTGGFFLSCNFSRKTFAAKDFAERVKEIIERYRFPRERLLLEMTGNASVKETELLKKNAGELKKLGVQMILDDFGSGFTSFLELKEYPADGLKLNKSMAAQIGTKREEAILGAVIRVGHELGLTVLATGVEEEAQALALCRLGCDAFQGYRFCRPLPQWEAGRRLADKEKEQRKPAL